MLSDLLVDNLHLTILKLSCCTFVFQKHILSLEWLALTLLLLKQVLFVCLVCLFVFAVATTPPWFTRFTFRFYKSSYADNVHQETLANI